MDPLTHIALGASLGYAAFGRRLGRHAATAGGLAAFAPDADVFISSAADPLLAVEYHRGFTHAVAFAPIGAALVAGLWLFHRDWRNPARWLPLWLASLVAYLSHELLDAATSYGTRLWWPFSDHREGWDLISIIDPPITLVLLTGLIWAVIRRRLKPAGLGLCAAAAYLGFGAIQHARAVHAVQAIAAGRGHTITRLEAMPTMANNIVWRTLYRNNGRIHADRIRVGWFSAAAIREGWSVPVVEAADLTPAEKVRDTRRSFARFAWFSEDWVGRSPSDATVLADMRYSLSSEAFDPIWGIRFTPPGASTEVEWINRTRDRDLGLRPLWDEITGRDARFRALPESRQPWP
jgi:inner membrane protein